MCLLFSHGEVSIADILDAMEGHRLASVICRIMVNSYCAWELNVVMADEYPQLEPRDGMASPLEGNFPCIACVEVGLLITISSQMHSFTITSILEVRTPHKFLS